MTHVSSFLERDIKKGVFRYLPNCVKYSCDSLLEPFSGQEGVIVKTILVGEEERFTLCQHLPTIIVTPAPVLARLKGLDNRVIGCVKMFGGVLVLRGILLDLRVPIEREERRLPERKKPFSRLQWGKKRILQCMFDVLL